ncbi:MAG: immunoglobulin domain-containing protein [Clostridia bacterium]|nr:immunoglobulin domain-containing protein [Clostridia bacterium]
MEISTWDEFSNAFKGVDKYSGKSYTFKLTKDLYMETEDFPEKQSYGVRVIVYGCNITFDFNGHTLNCDADSDNINNFISVHLCCVSPEEPVNLTFTDSVGGGGIFFKSVRRDKKTLSALYITEELVYKNVIPYVMVYPSNKVTFNGGIYSLESKADCREYYWSDLSEQSLWLDYRYRAAVVADHVGNIVINDGFFYAKALNNAANGPLAAFGTSSDRSSREIGIQPTYFVINGGVFQSSSASVYHFGNNIYNSKGYVIVPQIKGGIFIGYLSFAKDAFESFTTNNLKDKRLNFDDSTEVFRDTGSGESNQRFVTYHDLIYNTDKLIVLSRSFLGFKTSPAAMWTTTQPMERPFDMTETFSMSYKNLIYLNALFDDMKVETSILAGTDKNNLTVYDGITSKEINYNDYYDSNKAENHVYVRLVLSIIHNEKMYSYSTTYDVTLTPPKPATITAQPESVRVEPGEWAELTVAADHARGYVWYYYQDGQKIPLDQYKSMLFDDDEIEGETTDTLRINLDSVTSGTFYCVVKGLDGSTTSTSRATITFGGSPVVTEFSGGEYIEGGIAQFKLRANYADKAVWYVEERRSGNYTVYTLKEFAEATGCEYTERVNKLLRNNTYETTVVFYDVTEAFVRSYSVGYELSNKLGKIDFSPDNALPFTKKIEKPEITVDISPNEACYEGENLSFFFAGKKISLAEWSFEKPDEDGIMISYSIDDLREAFPESKFEATLTTDAQTGESTAKLKITNARAELSDYSVFAYAINNTGRYFVGVSSPTVKPVTEYKVEVLDTRYRSMRIDCVEEGRYTLVIARYNGGKLEGLYLKTLDCAKGRAVYDMGRDFRGNGVIKVMMINSKFQPLCEPA